MESVTGDSILLPVTTIDVHLFGKPRKIEAFYYDNAPVDVLVGRNCPDFKKVLTQAEGLAEIFQVTTRHQATAEVTLDREL